MNDKNGIGLANCGNCKRFQLCGRWSDKSEYHDCYNGDGLTPLAAAKARIAELEAIVEDQKRGLIERFNRARHYEDKYGELLRRQIDVGALVKPLVWIVGKVGASTGHNRWLHCGGTRDVPLPTIGCKTRGGKATWEVSFSKYISADSEEDAKAKAFDLLVSIVRAACGKGEK